MVLIEVLVLPRLALLLDRSGGARALLIIQVEYDGGVTPPPPPRAFLLLNGSNNKDKFGPLDANVGSLQSPYIASL